MADHRSLIQISPGRGLGWITLGASLHGILSRVKAQPQLYPQLELSYSANEPILDPVVLNLPANGIRLRFDGPDQRLRLIEILDFSKGQYAYKSSEVVRKPSTSIDKPLDPVVGPSFRHVYNRLFGPSYAGEYVAPQPGYSTGTYVLSYPGVAVRFPFKHKSWSEKADFVSLLSSSAASPASSIAIFLGASWPEARSSLYSKPPALPRSISLATKGAENVPDEVEEVVIRGKGRLEMLRRSQPPIEVILNETTPQDLIAELGPPDAIFRKPSTGVSIRAGHTSGEYRSGKTSSTSDSPSAESDRISAKSYTDDSDSEAHDSTRCNTENTLSDCFYNYFHHGFDAQIAFPEAGSTGSYSDGSGQSVTNGGVVVTKLFLHGNIPGSYSFNRHRRSRWRILVPGKDENESLTSEMRFTDLSAALKDAWRTTYSSEEEEKKMQRGMVLNRGWGESPESSVELLGGFEEGPEDSVPSSHAAQSLPNMSNTELFGFPGLLFEVLKNGTVTCLTVY